MYRCRMILKGRIECESCLAFMAHYLRRLDLESRIVEAGTAGIEIELNGPEAMIDMFEMANWLGPEDSLVHSIEVNPL